jgi:hypothetical protein
MAQTNYTPIQLYSSSTAANTPLAANLAAGELAINTADGILFYKDSSNVVQKIGYKLTPTTAGGTGLTSFTANGVVYASSTSALATGSALVFDTSSALGVGTSTPTSTYSARIASLAAAGTTALALDAPTGTNTSINFYYNGIAKWTTQVLTTGEYRWFDFTASTERMRIDLSGNLGIGGASTGSRLYVTATNPTATFKATTTGYPYAAFVNDGGDFYVGRDNSAGGAFGYAYANVIWGSGAQSTVFGTSNLVRMTLDASGNLGIGTTSPATKLHISTDGTYDPLRLQSTQSGYERSWTIGPNVGVSGLFVFRDVTAGQNRVAIDTSGNLLVGTAGLGTIGSSSGFQITPSGAMYSASTGDSVFSRRSANGTVITFRRDTTTVGSIDVTTTATSYVTSSDYRLKNTIAPMTGALAKVAALKPVTYKWNADGSDGEGFIAHELAEVVPQCVTGEKDAVDADGNPKYQGIDTSFLVATLTAAIQEQQALITQLTARINALEGA